MMLNTRTRPFRTSPKRRQIQLLLFPRESPVVGSFASTEVDLCGDDDVTTAEFEFLDDATAVNPISHVV